MTGVVIIFKVYVRAATMELPSLMDPIVGVGLSFPSSLCCKLCRSFGRRRCLCQDVDTSLWHEHLRYGLSFVMIVLAAAAARAPREQQQRTLRPYLQTEVRGHQKHVRVCVHVVNAEGRLRSSCKSQTGGALSQWDAFTVCVETRESCSFSTSTVLFSLQVSRSAVYAFMRTRFVCL